MVTSPLNKNQTSEITKCTKCWKFSSYDPAESKNICVPLGKDKFNHKAYLENTENSAADQTL